AASSQRFRSLYDHSCAIGGALAFTRVMAHKFTLVSRTTKTLKVRHVASGLRYTFRVSDAEAGRHILISVPPGRPSSRSVRAVLEKALLNRSGPPSWPRVR